MSFIQNVVKTFEEFTLQIPKIEIPDLGLTVLQGDSGSGKSTLLRILMGLEKCEGMEWLFKDQDLARLSPQERRL